MKFLKVLLLVCIAGACKNSPQVAQTDPQGLRPDPTDSLNNAYIEMYAPVAIAQMHKFDIPASVLLAQAMLESAAGTSRLALENKNPFGIRCYSGRCSEGHCSNPGTHKDFYLVYANAWEGWRDHAQQLSNVLHYSRLKGLDYKCWCYGLAGNYTPDKGYGDKLIGVIERYNLQSLDTR